MSRQRRTGTAPELALRRELHRRGLRYFVDRAPLRGQRRRADVVFPRRKLAVYVDGCFWHRCPQHATDPKNNGRWWADKLAGNVARDRATDEALRPMGRSTSGVKGMQFVGDDSLLALNVIPRTADVDRARFEIDVRPAQTAELSHPEPGVQRRPPQAALARGQRSDQRRRFGR